jgi:hypothetical protein
MDMTKNQTNLYSLGKNKDIIVNRFLEDNMIVSLVLPNYNSLTNTSPIDILMKDHIYKVISIDNSQLRRVFMFVLIHMCHM